MATLFFDGFDKGTELGILDRQYWSTQYFADPGYGFGAYSYNHTVSNYANQYKTISINNGVMPTGIFFSSYITDNPRFGVPGNNYPAFGSPPGFLALSNIPINDPNFLAPISYIQLSGFPQPQGNKTYFGARFLGLETKHTDYDVRIDPSRVDKPGRFDYRHPLLAFCSGNTTGLLLSIVKATGNNLSLLENQKMTMGIQVEQNNQILGIFDLNLNETISNYRVSSVHNNQVSNRTLSSVSGQILTLGSIFTAPNGGGGPTLTMLFSRWTHMEFLINNEATSSYLACRAEGIDVPIVDPNTSNTNKETWQTEMPISGFNYNNIRFFNRTYYKDFIPRDGWISATFQGGSQNEALLQSIREGIYYLRGAATLIDDVTLIDGVGQPGFWLGPNSKVIPLSPGIDKNVNTNGVLLDGPIEWSGNTSGARVAFKNYDGDNGILQTSISGAITAVRFDNHNFGDDTSSNWRTSFNDGIAGVKVYNSVRKNFLDTQFTNIFFTGVADSQSEYTQLVLNTNRDIYDATNKRVISKIQPLSLSYSIKKFDDPSVYFPTTDSYIYTSYGDLHKVDPGPGVSSNPSPPPENFFTIESWVYFPNGSTTITLYGKKPPESYPQMPNIRFDIPYANFNIICTTGYIQYDTYIDDVLLSYSRLYFPEPIATGTWNHIAVVSDAIEDFRGTLNNDTRYYNHQYRMTTYLNGVSGTHYESWYNYDGNLDVYTNNSNSLGWLPLTPSFSLSNLEFNGNGNSGLKILSSTKNITGFGNNVSPISGLLQEYSPRIKIPNNAIWSERINIPSSIIISDIYGGNDTYILQTGMSQYSSKPAWISPSSNRSIFWSTDRWSTAGYSETLVNTLDTNIPPKDGWMVQSHYGNYPAQIQVSYNLPIPNISGLSIVETRCNNRLAYMVTSAGLPELTGLYCLDDTYNGAYYYTNIDRPDYHLYNSRLTYDAGPRRWIIGSGFFNAILPNNHINSIRYVSSLSPTGEDIVSAQSMHDASLKFGISVIGNGDTTFTLLKNNISQYQMNRNSDGNITGIIPVMSGDILSIKADYGSVFYPVVNSPPSISFSFTLSSRLQNSPYYLPTEYVSTQQFIIKRVSGVVGKFLDNYTSTSTSDNNFSLFIGGGGYIDNYRLTHGTSRTLGLQSRTRYHRNFSVPTIPFPTQYSSYYDIGGNRNVTRNSYSTIQYYSMNNPATNQPWDISLIEPSGFLFGIKKL